MLISAPHSNLLAINKQEAQQSTAGIVFCIAANAENSPVGKIWQIFPKLLIWSK